MKRIRNNKNSIKNNNNRSIISDDPGNLKIDIELIKDSFSNIFCSFKSINGAYILIYTNELFYIISYDLTNSQKLTKIKFSNFDNFFEIRHFLDNINKRDLILFINFDTIKIINFSNWTCITQIKEKINKINDQIPGVVYRYKSIDKKGGVNACIFENNKKNYIATSHLNSQYFKFYDLNGNKNKDIKTPNKINIIIETYKNFIISGNYNCCTSYDFKNKKFKNYKSNENSKINYKFINLVVCKDKQDYIKLIAKAQLTTNIDKYTIFIWDFNSCDIINKTDLTIISFDSGFNLWNEKYIILGTGQKFKIYNLFKENFTQDIPLQGNYYFQIIIHPKHGKCIMYTDFYKKIHLLHE